MQKVILADCLDALKGMADNSVDSIVTDPPYGISFGDCGWDSDVPTVEIWRECFRVLKPGGHLLAFAATRTQHKMATRIEEAGFELRDMLAWVYGGGYPKSSDIAKSIDNNGGGLEARWKFTAWLRSTGVKAGQINKKIGSFMGGHYLSTGSQPAFPSLAVWPQLKELILEKTDAEIPEWVEDIVCNRGGREEPKDTSADDVKRRRGPTPPYIPKKPEALEWVGWGTGLKPAFEPITMARKPTKSYSTAANVMKYRVGAININGGRITGFGFKEDREQNPAGRWPTNFIHDASDPVYETIGEAARFFYCAKATPADRDAGLDDLEARQSGVWQGLHKPGNNSTESKNFHPTVKPTALMRYLCRLVTPPGGLVVDPFVGSGSTGKAAVLEGFDFIGIELDPDYVEIAKRRISHAAGELEMSKSAAS